jgi:hypothetical protein
MVISYAVNNAFDAGNADSIKLYGGMLFRSMASEIPLLWTWFYISFAVFVVCLGVVIYTAIKYCWEEWYSIIAMVFSLAGFFGIIITMVGVVSDNHLLKLLNTDAPLAIMKFLNN